VDFVVLFDEPSVAPLVAQVLPDVLVKSAQYAPTQIVGHEIVEQTGGRVVGVPMRGSYSTSQLIAKARRSA
jgi:D-beta-D-heptose 7-phosphate kinase/D-beta-D-heptose 1-phosphate adenosyltransferase